MKVWSIINLFLYKFLPDIIQWQTGACVGPGAAIVWTATVLTWVCIAVVTHRTLTRSPASSAVRVRCHRVGRTGAATSTTCHVDTCPTYSAVRVGRHWVWWTGTATSTRVLTWTSTYDSTLQRIVETVWISRTLGMLLWCQNVLYNLMLLPW